MKRGQQTVSRLEDLGNQTNFARSGIAPASTDEAVGEMRFQTGRLVIGTPFRLADVTSNTGKYRKAPLVAGETRSRRSGPPQSVIPGSRT